MEARFMAENPDGIEFTMKITMSARDWCSLRDQLTNSHPSWQLTQKIDSLLAQARKTFYPAVPSGDCDA